MEKPLEAIEKVDEDRSWLSLIPDGSAIISTVGFGVSFWTSTARIVVRLPSGGDEIYFMKLATSDRGLVMVRGEYESMRALWTVSPNMIPEPMGFGTYETDPDTHFFLCKFVELADELPEPITFCEKLADLHRRSMTMMKDLGNDSGRYGFHVTTCNGTVPQDNTWCESWEGFYIQSLKHEFMLEEEVHGPSEEIQGLLPSLYGNVCPRLLRPLETEGRTLKPCLVHGDLWEGTASVQPKTGQPYIFASSAFWAHNEYDMAAWRGARYRMGKVYIKEYFKHFPISPPEKDWDDRNLLYSIRADLHNSILYPQSTRFRSLIISSLEKLTAKFPNGYEGTASRKGGDTPVSQGESQGTATGEDGGKAAGVEATLPFIEQHAVFNGNIRPGTGYEHLDQFARNANNYRIIRHGIQELLAENRNPTESASDIGVGESAVSPWEGSADDS